MPHGSIFSSPKDGGGHKPLNSAAEELRVCPMIPSARDRVVWGLLVAEPAFAFAGTRSQSVTVRSGGYEPPFCQYGGWTVAAVRKTNNFLCPKTRPFFMESLIISSAVAAGSFVPALRFETLEIHKVCLRISNLDLCQNLSSSTLAEITSDSLNAKTPELTPRGKLKRF